MVHALEERWRVLQHGGILVDIRPYLGNMRLEVLNGEDHQLVGIVDDSELEEDHQAVQRALDHGLNSGLFTQEEERRFDYEYLWDTPDDLKAYVDENWTSRTIPNSLHRKARRMAVELAAPSRIRIRDERVITRFRKVSAD